MLDLMKIAIISASIAIGAAAHFYFNDPKDDAVITAMIVRVIEHETKTAIEIKEALINK